MLAFFLFSCLFLYVNSHPNNYCSGYCSANTYCAPSSCRREGSWINCQPCPSGKTSSKGAWDISQCTGCSKGKYYVSSTCKIVQPVNINNTLDKQNVKYALAVNIRVRQRLHVHHVKQVNIRQAAQIRVVHVWLKNILARLEVFMFKMFCW